MKTTISELLGWTKINRAMTGRLAGWTTEWLSPDAAQRLVLANDEEPWTLATFYELRKVWDAFTDEEHDAFRVALREIVLRDGPIGRRPPSMTWATEEQRTEALLRVKNR